MDDEFQDAFEKEMGGGTPTTATPPADPAPVTDPVPEAKPAPAEGEAQVPPAEKPETPPPAPEGEPATPAPDEKLTPEEEPPKFATKDDVKEAMREYDKEQLSQVEKVHSARDEIIEKLHPEGIDKGIYDTNGNIIKTAQDIVDRQLFNEQTGDAFTYEEAASWLLRAQQRMNENIQELNKYAEDIAEKNISLVDANQRVMQIHGDLLKQMPDIAKQLADEYVRTQLEFDPTGSYVTRVGMDPETYYNLTLAPYKQYNTVLAEKAALEASQKAQEEQAEQAERGGLPQRGNSKTKSATGDPFVDALIDEMNKD